MSRLEHKNGQAMKREEERFIGLMGRHFEEEGGPRIAGRLLGVLLMNQEPQSLDNLVELLQVSKASVSTNARLLEVRGVVEKIQLAGDRRDFYQVAPDARERMLRHMVERALLMTERLEVGLRAAREIRPEVCERFEGLIGFMGRACQEMVCRLEHEHSAGEGSTGVLLPDTNAHEANTHEANVR